MNLILKKQLSLTIQEMKVPLKVGYNEYGYPLCPNNSSFGYEILWLCREKGRADRIKWTCPKVHVEKGQYVCDCDNPCSTAKRGRTTYNYENMSSRMFPGLQRDSDEWNELYKLVLLSKSH